MPLSATDQKFLEVAISEAQAGFDEGGIPIGACLVSKDGQLIAKGRNMRMQKYVQTIIEVDLGDPLPCMERLVVWRMPEDFPQRSIKELPW